MFRNINEGEKKAFQIEGDKVLQRYEKKIKYFKD